MTLFDTMSAEDSLSLPSIAPATKAMTLLVADPLYDYYKFDSSSVPDLKIMADLIDEAWSKDYSAKGEAVFKYDVDYLTWLLKEDTFDGIWVTTKSGAPAGVMVLTRRHIKTATTNVPASYGSLFSIGTAHRRAGIGRRIYEVFFYYFPKDNARALTGVMDGNSGGRKVTDSFVSRDIQVRGAVPYWESLSREYVIWAACPDMAEVHRYMPLRGLVAKIALHPWVKHFIEFRYKAPKNLDYSVELVQPLGQKDSARNTDVAFAAVDLIKHYGLEHTNIAGTYRITFADGRLCEIYYAILKAVKPGLPDTQIGQLQFIDQGTATSKQVRRATKIVSDTLLKRGCVAILNHHTGSISALTLLLSGFLPSDRKIRYYSGCFHSLSPKFSVDGKLGFDLL